MDARTDGPRFKKLINRLHAFFRGGFEANESFLDSMWIALKDASYDEVSANAERIMATATKATEMPRASELRNAPARIPSPGAAAMSRKVEANAIRTWRELRQTDPVRFEIEFRIAQAETMLAQMPVDDYAASEWTAALLRWRGLRYAPLAEQEAAVAKLMGEP